MIKLFSAFSGIGAFEKALSNLNIDYELVGFSEIDKYAIESYCLLHNVDKSKNFGNISEIDKSLLPDFDLFTWGFPCQDFSLINTKRNGFNGNKSILFFQGLEILKIKRPKISIAENVSNLLSPRFEKELKIIISSLKELGYKTQILKMNSKEYGIPQNRDRVFLVSCLDKFINSNIPKTDLLFKAKDILEKEVSSKYYITEKQILQRKKIGSAFNGKFKYFNIKDFIIANAINTRIDVSTSNYIKDDIGIRQLTELECWLLNGWSKKDFDKVKHFTKTSLIKQAGNSIVIQVLEKIFKKIYLEA